MIALSTRPWLCYNYMSKYMITPLSYEPLEHACSFCSEQCAEGIVGICGSTIRIISPERLNEIFNTISIPLQYTPRKMLLNKHGYLVILETDHMVFNITDRERIKEQVTVATGDEEYKELNYREMGYPKTEAGKWASSIRILEPYELKTLELIELEDNEAAFSCFMVNFYADPNQTYFVVGVAKDLYLHPRTCSVGFIHTYVFTNQGKTLSLIHKVQIICLGVYYS